MSCLISADYDDCYEGLHCEIIKAKRQWRCDECSTPIFEGSDHEVFVGKIGDRINTHRTCLTCLSIRKKFLCSWTYEGIYEDISSALENEFCLEDCILSRCTLTEYRKLVSKISSLEDEDEEDDE
jgi:hypothetical protein